MHLHAQSRGALSQRCVESGPSNPPTLFVGKVRLRREIPLDESNTPEWETQIGGDYDAKFAESGYAIGHETFAAGFVDGRNGAVGYTGAKTLLTHGDGRRKSRGTAADDENICFEGSRFCA